MGLAVGLATVGVVSIASGAQSVDRSLPPILQTSVPGFAIRRLSGPVAIDGVSWIAVEPTSGTQTIFARNGEFALSLAEPNDEGDVERSRLTFADPGGRRVALSPDPVSYV